jgi:hypothetical protein
MAGTLEDIAEMLRQILFGDEGTAFNQPGGMKYPTAPLYQEENLSLRQGLSGTTQAVLQDFANILGDPFGFKGRKGVPETQLVPTPTPTGKDAMMRPPDQPPPTPAPPFPPPQPTPTLEGGKMENFFQSMFDPSMLAAKHVRQRQETDKQRRREKREQEKFRRNIQEATSADRAMLNTARYGSNPNTRSQYVNRALKELESEKKKMTRRGGRQEY